MKGRNRKTIRVRNKPARDAHWRRVARNPGIKDAMAPKPRLTDEAAKFYVKEAIQADEPEKGGA